MDKKKCTSIIQRFAQKGVFPHQFAFTLLIPIRNIFLSPNKLMQRLELKENSTVLEVGPGPGYFSIKIAQKISKGKLYLTDIQQEMLDFAEKRLNRKGIKNVEYHHCDGKTFPFPDNNFDVIFMVTVLGEVENKREYIREFQRIIKTNGILSISEQGGDPDRLSIDEIKTLMQDSNFAFYAVYENKNNFIINFRKRKNL